MARTGEERCRLDKLSVNIEALYREEERRDNDIYEIRGASTPCGSCTCRVGRWRLLVDLAYSLRFRKALAQWWCHRGVESRIWTTKHLLLMKTMGVLVDSKRKQSGWCLGSQAVVWAHIQIASQRYFLETVSACPTMPTLTLGRKSRSSHAPCPFYTRTSPCATTDTPPAIPRDGPGDMQTANCPASTHSLNAIRSP